MKPYKTVLKNRLKLAKGKVKQLHIVGQQLYLTGY